MKNFNIIQIIVDANRYYYGKHDEKYKLNVFKKIEKLGFIEFEKMVVSAPSTLMSLMTIMSGQPSYPLSPNYNDLDFFNKNFTTLNDLLKRRNYKLLAVASTKLFRGFVSKEFDALDKEYLPKNTSLSQHKWSNKQIFEIIKKINTKKILDKKNFYLLVWFNSRHDYCTSEYVEKTLCDLQKKKFFKNSIVMLSADHGYPDKIRGLVSDGEDLKKSGIPHDIILTNDNICVPFAIKFPDKIKINLSKSKKDKLKKITIPQSYIFSTILKVLGIPMPKKNIYLENGNILDVIKKPDAKKWKEQIIRSDARFIFQPERMSSVSNSFFKLIKNTSKLFEFYDLKNDHKELKNLINSHKHKALIEKFKNVLSKQDRLFFNMWETSINKKIISKKIFLTKIKKVLVLKYIGNSEFILIFLKIFYKKLNIHLCLDNEKLKNIILNKFPNITFFNDNKKIQSIVLIEDTLDLSNIQKLEKTDSEILFIIDINLNIYNNLIHLKLKIIKQKIYNTIRNFSYRKEMYKKNKIYFFRDLLEIVERLLKKTVSIVSYKK